MNPILPEITIEQFLLAEANIRNKNQSENIEISYIAIGIGYVNDFKISFLNKNGTRFYPDITAQGIHDLTNNKRHSASCGLLRAEDLYSSTLNLLPFEYGFIDSSRPNSALYHSNIFFYAIGGLQNFLSAIELRHVDRSFTGTVIGSPTPTIGLSEIYKENGEIKSRRWLDHVPMEAKFTEYRKFAF
jgi:hypothetical protein